MSVVRPRGYFRFPEIASCLKEMGWEPEWPYSKLRSPWEDCDDQSVSRSADYTLFSTSWFIAMYMGPLLASGEVRAAGIMVQTGELFNVPPSAWRIKIPPGAQQIKQRDSWWKLWIWLPLALRSAEDFLFLRLMDAGNKSAATSALAEIFHTSAVDAAFLDREIGIARADGSVDFVHAVISGRALAQAFGSKYPPAPPFTRPENIPEYITTSEQALESPVDVVPAPSKGGRPAKWDWQAITKEALRIANTPDGLPTKPVLTNQLKEWCMKEWGDEPADSAMRDFVTKIYPAKN